MEIVAQENKKQRYRFAIGASILLAMVLLMNLATAGLEIVTVIGFNANLRDFWFQNLINTFLMLYLPLVIFTLIVHLLFKHNGRGLTLILSILAAIQLISAFNAFKSIGYYLRENILYSAKLLLQSLFFGSLFIMLIALLVIAQAKGNEGDDTAKGSSVLFVIFTVASAVFMILQFLILWISVPTLMKTNLSHLLDAARLVMHLALTDALIFVWIWMKPSAKKPNDESLGKYNISLALHIVLLLVLGVVWQPIWVYRTTPFTNIKEDGECRDPMACVILWWFLPFYTVYWTHKTAVSVDREAKAAGVESNLKTPATLLAIFLPIVAYILVQSKINELAARDTKKESTEQIV